MGPHPLTEKAARLLYTVYCKRVGGKAFNGDPLPDWDTFVNDPAKGRQANAWRDAANELLCSLSIGIEAMPE